ncbi:MAG TPA: 3-deoxy-D-manno-octulosonic acid transferase [Acidobacteriaceae bacterium]
MLLAFYSFILALVLVVGWPYWLLQLLTKGKYREGLAERLGQVPQRLKSPSGKRIIWMHAVSVGEVLAATHLVRELYARAPQYRVLLSTTTRTAQRLARERVGADRTFYFPLDFGWIVRRYLKHLGPVLLVLVETEFWPNLLTECRKAGIPVAVVNGRISDRSYPRYVRLRRLWKRILTGISIALAQSEQDLDRLKAIGVPEDRVLFGGNLKFDVRTVQASVITKALRAKLPAGNQVLVCGSTLEGEEEILLDAFEELRNTFPTLLMILAPRHPERFDRVAELLRSSGFPNVRRSQWMERPSKLEPGTVMLLDSIGELASVYSLASVAFVGGSLVPAGGHNPLEPAQFAIPIVMGPHYQNFRAIVDRLLQEEALKLANGTTLVPILSTLLGDRDAANMLGVHALEVFDSQTGATDRAVEALLALVQRGTPEWSARR